MTDPLGYLVAECCDWMPEPLLHGRFDEDSDASEPDTLRPFDMDGALTRLAELEVLAGAPADGDPVVTFAVVALVPVAQHTGGAQPS